MGKFNIFNIVVYIGHTSICKLQIIRSARSKAQQIARRCANEYWTQLSDEIQTADATGEHQGNVWTRNSQSKTAPLKSAIDCLPTMNELDAEPTVEDLSKAIDSLVSGNAPDQQRDHLPVLARRSCTAGHEGRQDLYHQQVKRRVN